MQKEKEIFNTLLLITQTIILIGLPTCHLLFITNSPLKPSDMPIEEAIIFSTLSAIAINNYLSKFIYRDTPEIGKTYYSLEFNKYWGYNKDVQWQITNINDSWGHKNIDIKSDKGYLTISINNFDKHNFQIIEKKNILLTFIKLLLNLLKANSSQLTAQS